MKDTIRINGMSFYGYHGVSAAERETGRTFEVDCELKVDFAEASKSDQLTDTIDYGQVFSTVREIVEGKAYSLLESLAGDICRQVLDRFPAYEATVRVRKMNPPIAGQLRSIEVEMTRAQADISKLIDDSPGG